MQPSDDAECRSIERVRLAYSAYYDAQALDPLVSLFTEDAICHFPAEFGGDWIGREAIRDNFALYIKAAGEPFDAIHVVSNPWIQRTSEDTANGRWYLRQYLTRQYPGSPFATPGGDAQPLMLIGLYEDVYRKEAGHWLLARTRMSMLWPTRNFDGPLV